MKTTVDLPDALFQRARKLAKKRGTTLRSLIEDGLLRVLNDTGREASSLSDCRVGDKKGSYPLEGKSWQEVRDLIYGDES